MRLTVQDLIDKLQLVDNKDTLVFSTDENGDLTNNVLIDVYEGESVEIYGK